MTRKQLTRFKIILIFILLFNISFSQDCVKLYIDEHISGSPICKLSKGDYIEICEESRMVYGCPRDFYIYNEGWSNGSLTYKLSLDRGWSVHYMDLAVNTANKLLGFELQGQTAIYSYVTEDQMKKIQAQRAIERKKEEERERIREIEREKEREKIHNQKLEQDKLVFAEVNRLLKLDDLINANSKLKELNFDWSSTPSYWSSIPSFDQLKSEIINKEKNRFTKIDDLAKNQKFKEAFDLYKTLLNPGEYIFDKSSWSTIEEKILIDNYRTLNEGFKTKNLKDFIQVYLEEKNKSIIEDLNNEEIRLFIEKNKDGLSKLTIGNYKVRISPNGNIYINEVLPTDYYELVKKYIDLYNEFKVEVNSQFILILTEVTSPQYTSPKKWVLNDKYKDKILFSKNSFAVISDKDLSPINNLKSFKYVDRDRDSEIKGNKYYLSSNEKIAYQTDFPKNKMGLYIPQSTTKYANSLSVSSITDYKFDRYIKLKKARSKKIIKNAAIISSVAFCTSWLVMRYKERHTANQY